MRETRYKAQADSKDSILSLLEARVAESEKARKDYEDKMKLKIEALEQVHTTPKSLFVPPFHSTVFDIIIFRFIWSMSSHLLIRRLILHYDSSYL